MIYAERLQPDEMILLCRIDCAPAIEVGFSGILFRVLIWKQRFDERLKTVDDAILIQLGCA
jgi:hypothetical protein